MTSPDRTRALGEGDEHEDDTPCRTLEPQCRDTGARDARTHGSRDGPGSRGPRGPRYLPPGRCEGFLLVQPDAFAGRRRLPAGRAWRGLAQVPRAREPGDAGARFGPAPAHDVHRLRASAPAPALRNGLVSGGRPDGR